MADLPAPTLADAVAALKKFQGDMLENRYAHSGRWWHVGEPAPAEQIAYYRTYPGLLPPALVDLYELMNGCRMDWGFFSIPMPPQDATPEEMDAWDHQAQHGSAEGRFYLPPLDELEGLRTDKENEYTFFGPGTLSLLFDQSQPEYGTWLVAYSPDAPPKPNPYYPDETDMLTDDAAYDTADVANAGLVFLHAKVDELHIPVGLAEYILQGLAHGFAWSWQQVAWDPQWGGRPYAEGIRATMARLQAGWEQS